MHEAENHAKFSEFSTVVIREGLAQKGKETLWCHDATGSFLSRRIYVQVRRADQVLDCLGQEIRELAK